MKAVLQRVDYAKCIIDNNLHSEIREGLLVFLGIVDGDNDEDINWLVNKIVNMRIFSDKDSKMNLSTKEIEGEIMIISQFTLHASTKKGNRPSFISAAKPELAIPIYQKFIDQMSREIDSVVSGEFGAHMNIDLINNGPVTIIIDSKDKK